jgi:hypothetical protein
MAIVNNKVSALRKRTSTKSYSVEVKVNKPDFTEAVYILNDYLMSDAQLKNLMGGPFVIQPMVIDAPSGGPSTPYIRYVSLPAIGPIWRVRADIVRYYIGSKSYKESGKIQERLKELLIVDDSLPPFPLKNDKFKIQSIDFLGGTAPTGPDQEEGVMERGVNVAIIYTVLS